MWQTHSEPYLRCPRYILHVIVLLPAIPQVFKTISPCDRPTHNPIYLRYLRHSPCDIPTHKPISGIQGTLHVTGTYISLLMCPRQILHVTDLLPALPQVSKTISPCDSPTPSPTSGIQDYLSMRQTHSQPYLRCPRHSPCDKPTHSPTSGIQDCLSMCQTHSQPYLRYPRLPLCVTDPLILSQPYLRCLRHFLWSYSYRKALSMWQTHSLPYSCVLDKYSMWQTYSQPYLSCPRLSLHVTDPLTTLSRVSKALSMWQTHSQPYLRYPRHSPCDRPIDCPTHVSYTNTPCDRPTPSPTSGVQDYLSMWQMHSQPYLRYARHSPCDRPTHNPISGIQDYLSVWQTHSQLYLRYPRLSLCVTDPLTALSEVSKTTSLCDRPTHTVTALSQVLTPFLVILQLICCFYDMVMLLWIRG